jgi:hypothetical protein
MLPRMSSYPSSPQRKLFKFSVIVFGILTIGALLIHIWFINNARSLLKDIVTTKSHGKLKLELSKLSFDFLSAKLQIQQANILSTDTLNSSTSYEVRFQKLTLHLGSFWTLLIQKKLLLDSIRLQDPFIEVTQWKKDTSASFAKNGSSIPHEMGKLYNSMLDGLDVFGIKRININNAKISLVNKINPGVNPVIISNISLNLIRTAETVNKRDEYIENEQMVDLNISNQNITLPDGRHQLSFKNFTLQLFNKRIELDSCTVTAISMNDIKTSYSAFFNKILLIGVDFSEMYRHNLIKADSVYCENPLFNVDLNTYDVGLQEQRPDAKKIIHELTGDLDLAFVGVKDAGIHIKISGKKNRSLFNSNKDDFEMREFRINSDSSEPVTVARFDMLVRDYHLYNEDSSTAYTFDSIHFVNNKIVLNNFYVSTSSSKNKLRNERDFKIPYFELTGLDWYQLVFEENLLAKDAVLYQPVINYVKKTAKGSSKKKNIHSSIQALDDLLTLDRLKIIQGQLHLNMGEDRFINLKNVNLDLFSNVLLASKNKEGLLHAFKELSFSNGVIEMKGTTILLQNVQYRPEELLHADKFDITSKASGLKATAHNVSFANIFLNEEKGSVVIDGLSWQSAIVAVKTVPHVSKTNNPQKLSFRNISGNNSKLYFSDKQTTIATFIQSVRLQSLTNQGSESFKISNLFIAGRDLDMQSPVMKISASSYLFSDLGSSFLNDLKVNRLKQTDSLTVQVPHIDFSVDVNSLLANNPHFTNIDLTAPVIKMAKRMEPASNRDAANLAIQIDHLLFRDADIHFTLYQNDSVIVLNIPRYGNSLINASGLKIDNKNIKLDSTTINTYSGTLTKKTGEVLGVENGKIDISLSDLKLDLGNEQPSWSATINDLNLVNPNSFVFGKNRSSLRFDQASAGNLKLSSGYISSFDQIAKYNVSAWIRTTTGQYIDSNTTLQWFNAAYNSDRKVLRMDSFNYNPTQPRDLVMAHTNYQTDYITFHSGPVQVNGFNLEKYKRDSSIILDAVDITNPVITVYRDKQPPLQQGVLKSLPVDLIKNIPLPISMKRINIIDGYVSYTEKNAKTRSEGTLILTHLNGQLENIKNRNLGQNDSLSLTATAYLMDSTALRLTVLESYTDTLSGFLMTMRLKPTTLTFLNPVLIPLSNVKITSGTIDSFQLRAIGQENLAIGEMKMCYHNLRIKLTKGEEKKSGLMSRVGTLVVNAFIIKKNNNGRTGLIYFERLRDRSFFNYIVKMTFSGMATSIGVKKNRKYLRQYKRQLRQRNLPPIDFKY